VRPRALRDRSAAAILSFEETFEPLGLPALAIQVITGLWMGWIDLPGFHGLLNPANPVGMLVGVKLLLLAGTAALAAHARLRLVDLPSGASMGSGTRDTAFLRGALGVHERGFTRRLETSSLAWPCSSLAAHGANAGYVVAAHCRRRGIGSRLCPHSLQTARPTHQSHG